MSKHTGGDWLVHPFKARVIEAATGVPICELLWPTDLRSEDETFANGELISRAPDLIRELTEAREALRELVEASEDIGTGSESMKRLRAARAAARNLLDASAREVSP